MNVLELDFERTKVRYLLFKARLRSILYGADIDNGPVISHQQCAVGQWIYDHALNCYGHVPEMHDLEKVHIEIHALARKLVLLYKNGKADEARAGLPEIETIADKLTSLLSVVARKIKEEGKEFEQTNVYDAIQVNYQELLDLNALLSDLDERIKREAEENTRLKKRAKEQENKFRQTIMQAPVGITILRGKDLIVEMANASYLEIINSREEEIVGKPLFESLPEIKIWAEPLLLEVLEAEKPYYGNEFEVNLNRSGDSETCYFNFVCQPLLENENMDGIFVVVTEVTARVKVKQALQESENQFRNLVTQSQFAKAIFRGEEFIISLANESMLKNLWRRELHDVAGRRLLDVFPELERQKLISTLTEVYKTGETYRENEAPVFINGTGGIKNYYLDYQCVAMFETDGQVSGIMVSVNDVTEKVEFRKKLADSANRLSLATEGTQLATWDLDLQTREIIYSGRLAEIYGYRQEKKLTHPEMRARIHPDDLHDVVEKAFALAQETGAYYYEARILSFDGPIRWIRTQGKVLFDDDHNPLRMLGTMMDITERKEAEMALKTSEGKFRTLADSMPQFIWTGDVNGNLNYFNKAVFNYSGLSFNELDEGGWLQLVHPEERDQNLKLWHETVKNGTDFLMEHRLSRSDGEYRWHLSSAIPQKDMHGSIQMWVGTSTDIHDSKLFIDQLESQVQLRTHELTAANDELIRTNMELAQFAYVASHDLQEPLRKIQTFATRILETENENLSARGKDYFNRMQNSSTRMQQLILDLLAFSRANAVEKHFEEAELNVLLQTAKEQLHDVILQKNAVITSKDLPVLHVIVYQFEQLFTNLLANALKFTSPGVSPVIEISAGKILGRQIDDFEGNKEMEYHFISFKDNGIGFDQQFKNKIFQVFQRLHNKNDYDGTGIGLAICKKITDNHHGFIGAVSEPGRGATFIVYIPVI